MEQNHFFTEYMFNKLEGVEQSYNAKFEAEYPAWLKNRELREQEEDEYDYGIEEEDNDDYFGVDKDAYEEDADERDPYDCEYQNEEE